MKNGNAWRVVQIAATVIFALLMFMVGGWRSEVADAKSETSALATKVGDHSERLAVLENTLGRMAEDIGEIKRAVKEGN